MDQSSTPAQRAGLPDLATLHVVGVFDTDQAAAAAESALEAASIPRAAISVIAKPAGTAAARIDAGHTNARQTTAKGLATGAMIGGLAAVALAVPGIGPLLAAGPLVALLSGSVLGGTLGALVGSFLGLGMTSDQAQEYVDMIRAGATVVDVLVTTDTAAEDAAGILTAHGAHHVKRLSTHL